MNENPTTRDRIRSEASEWLVHTASDTATDADHKRFAQWLAADPEHKSTYQELESIFNDFADLKHLADERPLAAESYANEAPPFSRSESPRMPGRSGRLGTIMSAIATTLIVAIGGAWFLSSGEPLRESSHFETTVAEIRTIELSDGSTVTLSAKTEIEATMDGAERLVVLRTGQAFFEVQPDASRPFIVSAGETRVRVVGTKFDVRMGPEAVNVSVLEGEVRVGKVKRTTLGKALGSEPRDVHVLTAGQKVVSPIEGNVLPVQPVSLEKLGAWREGVLVYENAKLLDVVSDVNRYYSGTIEFEDVAVSDLRVTAAFRPDQVDKMLQTLSRALPVEAVRGNEGQIILTSAAPNH